MNDKTVRITTSVLIEEELVEHSVARPVEHSMPELASMFSGLTPTRTSPSSISQMNSASEWADAGFMCFS
jgi:hypothetical protein